MLARDPVGQTLIHGDDFIALRTSSSDTLLKLVKGVNFMPRSVIVADSGTLECILFILSLKNVAKESARSFWVS